MCNRWLSVDRGDGAIERLLPAATEKDLGSFEYLFFTRSRQVSFLLSKKIKGGHSECFKKYSR